MSKYQYIQRNHAIVVPPSQTVSTVAITNPWLTSTSTNLETTTTTENPPASGSTSVVTRVETLDQFLARVIGTIVYFFVNDAGELYGVIVDSTPNV